MVANHDGGDGGREGCRQLEDIARKDGRTRAHRRRRSREDQVAEVVLVKRREDHMEGGVLLGGGLQVQSGRRLAWALGEAGQG